jgi:hypothetical protein
MFLIFASPNFPTNIFQKIFSLDFSKGDNFLSPTLSGLQLLTLFTELCRQLVLPICIAQVAEAL